MSFFRTANLHIATLSPQLYVENDKPGRMFAYRTASAQPVDKINERYLYAVVSGLHWDEPNDNGDYFAYDALHEPIDNDRFAYHTWQDKPNLVNHRERDRVGYIPDVYAVKNENSIDMLIATEHDSKLYPNLTKRIAEGSVSDVSMGVSVRYSICSECGNMAEDEHLWCTCLSNYKGRKHPVTGRYVYEKNYGLTGMELSWIVDADGADPKAKRKLIVAGADFGGKEDMALKPIKRASSSGGGSVGGNIHGEIASMVAAENARRAFNENALPEEIRNKLAAFDLLDKDMGGKLTQALTRMGIDPLGDQGQDDEGSLADELERINKDAESGILDKPKPEAPIFDEPTMEIDTGSNMNIDLSTDGSGTTVTVDTGNSVVSVDVDKVATRLKKVESLIRKKEREVARLAKKDTPGCRSALRRVESGLINLREEKARLLASNTEGVNMRNRKAQEEEKEIIAPTEIKETKDEEPSFVEEKDEDEGIVSDIIEELADAVEVTGADPEQVVLQTQSLVLTDEAAGDLEGELDIPADDDPEASITARRKRQAKLAAKRKARKAMLRKGQEEDIPDMGGMDAIDTSEAQVTPDEIQQTIIDELGDIDADPQEIVDGVQDAIGDSKDDLVELTEKVDEVVQARRRARRRQAAENITTDSVEMPSDQGDEIKPPTPKQTDPNEAPEVQNSGAMDTNGTEMPFDQGDEETKTTTPSDTNDPPSVDAPIEGATDTEDVEMIWDIGDEETLDSTPSDPNSPKIAVRYMKDKKAIAKSYWEVVANNRPAFRVNAEQAFGQEALLKFAQFSGKAYGETLRRSVKRVGIKGTLDKHYGGGRFATLVRRGQTDPALATPGVVQDLTQPEPDVKSILEVIKPVLAALIASEDGAYRKEDVLAELKSVFTDESAYQEFTGALDAAIDDMKKGHVGDTPEAPNVKPTPMPFASPAAPNPSAMPSATANRRRAQQETTSHDPNARPKVKSPIEGEINTDGVELAWDKEDKSSKEVNSASYYREAYGEEYGGLLDSIAGKTKDKAAIREMEALVRKALTDKQTVDTLSQERSARLRYQRASRLAQDMAESGQIEGVSAFADKGPEVAKRMAKRTLDAKIDELMNLDDEAFEALNRHVARSAKLTKASAQPEVAKIAPTGVMVVPQIKTAMAEDKEEEGLSNVWSKPSYVEGQE